MASAMQFEYLPALDQCLDGKELVIPSQSDSSSALEHFLKNETTQQALAHSLAAPTPSSAASKSNYETRTAAITTRTERSTSYNIDELQSDVQWLSGNEKIDEVAALRIVALEWQQRSACRLTTQWTSQELTGLQRATSDVNAALLSSLSSGPASTVDPSDSDSSSSRHARQSRLLYLENVDRLAVLESLVSLHIRPTTSATRSPTWVKDVASHVFLRLTAADHPLSRNRKATFASHYVEALKSRLLQLNDCLAPEQRGSQNVDELTLVTKHSRLLEELVLVLRTSFVYTTREASVSGEEDVVAWFTFMDETNFLSDLPVLDASRRCLTDTAHALVSVISTALLNVSDSQSFLNYKFGNAERTPSSNIAHTAYLESEMCVEMLTSTLLGAASCNLRHVGPVVLAWSIITQTLRELALMADNESRQLIDDGASDFGAPLSRRSSLRGSVSRSSRPGALIGRVLDVLPGEDPIALMGNAAVSQMGAFDVLTAVTGMLTTNFGTASDVNIAVMTRETFLTLLRDILPLVTYGPDILQSLFAVLSYDSIDGSSAPTGSPWPAEPAQSVLDDSEVLGPRLIDQVLKRYPYELGPFMSCLATLSKSEASIESGESRTMLLLENLSTFTMVMPADFQAYELLQEDEMANCIRLTRATPIFNSNGHTRDISSEPSLSIAAGSIGTILNDSRPFVICWQHAHSSFEYLGCLLSTRMSNSRLLDASKNEPVDCDTATDILLLFTSVLDSLFTSGNMDTAKQLLGRMSNGLARNDDIIRVALECFEAEMQQHGQQNPSPSLSLLEACIRFMTVVVKLCPERIWSFLARSKLLASLDDTNTLTAIVNASEVVLGTYPFLRSCIALFDSLVSSGLSNSDPKRTSSKSLTRYSSTVSSGTSSDRAMSAIILSFQRVLTDFLHGMSGWRFVDTAEHIVLQSSILRILETVLDCAFSVEETVGQTQDIVSVFRPAAYALLDTMLTKDKLAFQSFFGIFIQGLGDQQSISIQERWARRDLINKAITLCTVALNASQITQTNGSALIERLLEAMPLLIRLLAADSAYHVAVINLITSLVTALNQIKVPPSLLVHVSAEATQSFIDVLSQVRNPLMHPEADARTWHMISTIVSNKQQLLAIYILTGASPRERLSRETSDKDGKTINLLSAALDQLSKLGSIAPRRAKSMLAFVANSQNHWPWVTAVIRLHPNFISAITDWLTEMQVQSRAQDAEVATRIAHENQMAGSIADILASYLHGSSQSEVEKMVATVLPKLHWLRDHAVDVSSYNHSLHANLTKNFAQNFPNCDLQAFKRSSLHSTDYGRDFYYNLDRAEKILGTCPAWDRKNGQSFVDEVARASVNLALVDSEIVLLKQWEGLALELGARLANDPQVQQDLAKTIRGCLRANTEAALPEGFRDDLAEQRAHLAFALLQRLVSAKSAEPAVRELVLPAWEAVRLYGEDFREITQSKDADFYRLLLRILFLTLQTQVKDGCSTSGKGSNDTHLDVSARAKTTTTGEKGEKPSNVSSVLLEVLQKVVAVNFRALCSSVHDDASTVDPADFVLLTAIMQSILGAKDMQSHQAQIATIVADNSLVKYAISLYSWSHSLSSSTAISTAEDPIYGLISVLFLLSMSSIPLCAEEMATSCVLAHISTAATSTRYFRNARSGHGSGPFDTPARAHDIWTRGILPLCLNILEAVGPAIAGEVASFLNSFPGQIARLERDLSSKPVPAGSGRGGRNVIDRGRGGSGGGGGDASDGTGAGRPGGITLNLASEAHSLALLSTILERLRATAPSLETAGVRADEMEELRFDRTACRELVESMMGPRQEGSSALFERIVPVGSREEVWARLGGGGGSGSGGSSAGHSVLEKKVLAELKGAVDCLSAPFG